MSTRASIRITEGDDHILLYHHCDGYPEGVGAEIKEFLNSMDTRYGWDPESQAD